MKIPGRVSIIFNIIVNSMNNKFLDMVINGFQCVVINSPLRSVKIICLANSMYEIEFLQENLQRKRITCIKHTKSLKYSKQVAKRYIKDGTISKTRYPTWYSPAGVNRGTIKITDLSII